MAILRITSFLLLCCFACNKTFESEYYVNVIFPVAGEGTEQQLLLTDKAGKLIHTFKIPTQATSFSDKVTVSGKHLTEEYDLHLVIHNTFAGANAYRIYSYLGVKNGELTAFDVFPVVTASTGTFKVLKITGVTDFQSFHQIGSPGALVYITEVDAEQNAVYARWDYSPREDIMLQLLSGGMSQTGSYHIDASKYLAQDTVVLDISDFVVPEALEPIDKAALPGSPFFTRIGAIAPNGSRFCILKDYPSEYPGSIGSDNTFYKPPTLPSDWLLAAEIGTSFGVYTKMFAPGAPIVMDKSVISIDNFATANNLLQIETSGAVDMVTITANYSNIYWQLSGPAARFQTAMPIPDLSYAAPFPERLSDLFATGYVSAAKSELQSEDQFQAGFPVRSLEPLMLPRSGYEEVRKYY